VILIPLKQYRSEAEVLLLGAQEYIRHASKYRYKKILDDLGTLCESNNETVSWKAWNIDLETAKCYDRASGQSPPVRVRFGFDLAFQLHDPKAGLWALEKAVTQIQVYIEDSDKPAVSHFHVDLKNPEQLGPLVHVQFSEELSKRLGLAMGVPRIPFPIVLPTDCLDFVLSEFFPREWGKQQAGIHAISRVRKGQRRRIEALLGAAIEACSGGGRTPVAALQNWKLSAPISL